MKTTAWVLLTIGALILAWVFAGKVFNPKTDIIKQNRLKLQMMYGVPEEWLTLCDPAETYPIDENCSQWIRVK
jgi:hypothetical protein